MRTARFSFHVNAYVAYYARAFEAKAEEAKAVEAKNGEAKNGGASGAASEETLDPALVAELGACSDDVCARKAFRSTPYAAGLGSYLNDKWNDDADDVQRSLGQVAGRVLDLEDLLAPALASQIGSFWPNDPVDVFFARAPRVDAGGRDGPLIDTGGECFSGKSTLVECVFTRALETLLPESELGKGITAARAKENEEERPKTQAAVACVAAVAVDAAVSATEGRYAPTRRFAEACAPTVRKWLGEAWGKRMRKEVEATEFGKELVEEMARVP